jgi:hypothetical protein
MVKYDINVDVKYKRIEKELLENYFNKVDNKEIDTKKLAEENPDRAIDEAYDETDITFICDELYRFELLSAFKAESILDDELDKEFAELWQLISGYNNFTLLVNKFSKKMCFEEDGQRLAFTLMFNYDLYYIVHQCLREYIQTNNISKNLLDELDQEIDKMNF